ncbi:MAG: DUF2927 domain-containing protein [Shimia sp.]
MRNLLFAGLVGLVSCAPGPIVEVQASAGAIALPSRLPTMKTFTRVPQRPVTRANSDIARDFLDLVFRMENGSEVPAMTRFEGPITLRLLDNAPSSFLRTDLTKLLARLRIEAGLNVNMTGAPSANITVQPIRKEILEQAVPNAACFVVPNVKDWGDFLQARGTSRIRWSRVSRRVQVAVFVPVDAAPQEVRDCLHEEIAQALGPLNDMYRLPDSVFNDDNVHTVLTPFDMLVLKTYYAPELRNGMTRDEVAARLPGILARLNPAGQRFRARPQAPTPAAWSNAINSALGLSRAPLGRKAAAEEAIRIAQDLPAWDPRRGFSQYALGRLLLGTNPEKSRRAFAAADVAYAGLPETSIHRAHVALQLAAFALVDGDAEQVLRHVDPNIRVAVQHENAILLSSLLMFRAEALDMLGRTGDAKVVRNDAIGWARYGFGTAEAVEGRLREIAQLNDGDDSVTCASCWSSPQP